MPCVILHGHLLEFSKAFLGERVKRKCHDYNNEMTDLFTGEFSHCKCII